MKCGVVTFPGSNCNHDMMYALGNILGQEQSGVIQEVGFSMYNKMLEKAVALHKSGKFSIKDYDISNENICLHCVIVECKEATCPLLFLKSANTLSSI